MRIIISHSSSEPIYKQIVYQLKELILKGQLKAGDALPSIRNLAKELQISVITTKRAYEELEREGFIQTVQGKGSFVATHNKEMLKKKKYSIVEEKLMEAVLAAKSLELTWNELIEILQQLYDKEA
ncbi:MAG: GntR family transcriptional regulator [Clostridiales bacterium]|jgi:GntR family transcriptional regulator|nr:GntR family transcriptional regulator [Clostridiales bacterium]